MNNGVPDLVRKDLRILFIGINPGLKSGEIKHHFAGKSNRFWKFLEESGLTPVRLSGLKDDQLLNLGFGITNIVPRVTATASELTPGELRDGAERLRKLILENRPLIAVYLGKVVYRYFSGLPEFPWGLQLQSVIEGVHDFVIPNPSGLNRIPIPEQLQYYIILRKLLEGENHVSFTDT